MMSNELAAEIKAALEGDSNDAEHDALVSTAGDSGSTGASRSGT